MLSNPFYIVKIFSKCGINVTVGVEIGLFSALLPVPFMLTYASSLVPATPRITAYTKYS